MHRWRLPLALGAFAILVLAGVVVAANAWGGGGGSPGASATAAGTSSPGGPRTPPPNSNASPKLDGPANKYSILNPDDVGTGWITDIPGTTVLTVDNYPKPPAFASQEEGKRLMQEWGYKGGFETSVDPEGRELAWLNGGYKVITETHLFADEAGARKAFDYFVAFLGRTPGISSIPVDPIGNDSKAFMAITGKVRGSGQDQATHELVFRRGNMVAIVATYGSAAFMTIDAARDIAAVIDGKALGTIAAPTPTPTTNFTPPIYSSRTPSPSATSSP